MWIAPWSGQMNLSQAVIDYLSGQNGTILPGQDYSSCPVRKISLKFN